MPLAAAVLLPLLLLATPVPAQPERAPPGRLPPQNNLLQEQADEPDTRISRREASELARGSFPGRVLSIRLDNRQWRVRMDQDGTVFNVLVDANTGAVARSAD